MLLGNVCKIRTGKLDANAGSPNGKYSFFTCAQTPLKIDFYKYDCECVLVAGNCDLNVKYFNGKFEAYQRTYIIESLDKQQLDTKFLYYYLSSYIDNLKNKRAGGVIKFIKLGDLTSIEIPNLGLNEQIKCVHELETIEHRRMAEEDSLICYESLIKSRFIEVVSSTNQQVQLNDLCLEKPEYGAQSAAVPFDTSRPRYIRITDINDDGSLNDDMMCSSNSSDDLKYKLSPGDILFARTGATVGKTYLGSNKNEIFAGYLIRFKLDVQKILPEFLFCFTKTNEYWNWVKIKQSGSGQPGINAQKYSTLTIPLPSISIQKSFVSFYKQVDKLKFNCQQRIKLYQELLDKKMDEYFG